MTGRPRRRTAASTIAALSTAVALAVPFAPAAASDQEVSFQAIFEDGLPVTFPAEIREVVVDEREVIVELPGNKSYPVPVLEEVDIAALEVDMPVNVTITQGLIVDISPAYSNPRGFTFEVLNGTDTMSDIPNDVLVREVMATTVLKSINRTTGAVTFESPAGDARTAVLANPQRMLTGLELNTNDLFTLTYYDMVAVTPR